MVSDNFDKKTGSHLILLSPAALRPPFTMARRPLQQGRCMHTMDHLLDTVADFVPLLIGSNPLAYCHFLAYW